MLRVGHLGAWDLFASTFARVILLHMCKFDSPITVDYYPLQVFQPFAQSSSTVEHPSILLSAMPYGKIKLKS